MAEENMGETTATVEVAKTTEAAVTQEEKKYSRDELNKIITAEKSKALEDFKNKAESERTEAEKVAKMRSDEKIEYEKGKALKERDSALAELNSYKLKDEAVKIAAEKNIPNSLVDLINYKTATAEDVKNALDNISKTFSAEVEKALADKLKGNSPRQVATNVGSSEQQYLDTKYAKNPYYKK